MTLKPDASTLGGKGATWQMLSLAGLPVPDGFCVATDDLMSLEAIEHALEDLRRRRRVVTVAVRSSAVGEDGSSQALAGLFESFLDVPADAASVLRAVIKCRALGASARAVSATGDTVAMGVLIQEMIRPSRAGVLFTSDPRGEVDGMVLEVVDGHPRSLVEGRTTGDRFIVGSDPVDVRGVDVRELRRLGRVIEGLLGGSVDIEWAVEDGRIVILQARRITSLDALCPDGFNLVPVAAANVGALPRAVVQHDKIALRLVASKLGIRISSGFVAIANAPTPDDVRQAAKQIADWGDFIAVLLVPFQLEGEIFRRFCTGATAPTDLVRFVDAVAAYHRRFAFLLKELQETAFTGVALRRPDGSVHIEIIQGHFITKGIADPSVYRLDPLGSVVSHTLGRQDFATQVTAGRKVRLPVTSPPTASETQLADVYRAVVSLADLYPNAGIEFGFTPAGEFFLVDLYQSGAAVPPDRADVLSHGRVVGRIRILDLANDAVDQSIERHVHSRREGGVPTRDNAEVIVVRHPLQVLDRLIYEAQPGTLGFICEGGALLCHLAVVMREHGVPGLVVPDAMTKFTDGNRVVLDTRPGSSAAVTLV